MLKKAFLPMLMGSLFSVSDLACAVEPMQLTESQMDTVSAGQTSAAVGSASSLFGTAHVRATTYAYSGGSVRITRAGALSVATGFGSLASASAGSSF
ncbi:hypothetical protein [Noviherbaspirillum saxi]|uniref:hypothetical protein n=1 Tax=Noviherbaspirillum saxi TaxID=2320863 RepID=UPI0011C3DE0C|nr:hypothetical protein [Noviherbaspirillum saxi]